MTVVLRGKYLRGFELRGAGRAVEKLVELLALGKMAGGKDLSSCLTAADFRPPKALNSNQLGNSLRINIGTTREKSAYSHFADLHISGSLTFRFRFPDEQEPPLRG